MQLFYFMKLRIPSIEVSLKEPRAFPWNDDLTKQ